MANGKRITSLVFTGATAAAAAGFNPGPAQAAGSGWHITPPNSTHFTGHNIGPVTLSDMSCPTVSFWAHVSGNGKSGVPKQLFTISNVNFGTCFLQTISFSVKLVDLIGFTAGRYNSTSGRTVGWVGRGSVTANPLSVEVTGKNLSCHLTVSGSEVPASFSNTSDIFTINPDKSKTLHIKHQSGCLGLFQSSASTAFHGSFSTSPPVTITYG